MQIQSPLSNVCDVLDQTKTSALQYQATLIKNEAATRAVLIDPLLRAIGWDTANTFMVEVEKTLGQTRVDYALFDMNGDVKVIVEAKSLGAVLSTQAIIMNLVAYAFTYGLQDVFLTDGLIWQHFTDFQPGKVAPTRTLNLAVDDLVECAAYLVHRLDAAKFWPETQTIDALAQQVALLESAVSTLQKEMALFKNSGAAPIGDKTNTVHTTPYSRPFISLTNVPDLTNTKPITFRLPDGSEAPVRKWKDVLLEACKFAFANSAPIQVPFPDVSGRKVNLVSKIQPPPGISYNQESYENQTVYIYSNYDSNKCVANAIHILSRVPVDKLKVKAAIIFDKT